MRLDFNALTGILIESLLQQLSELVTNFFAVHRGKLKVRVHDASARGGVDPFSDQPQKHLSMSGYSFTEAA